MVDPKLLCQKHLCGEHLECHMFVGTLNKGYHVGGYIRKGLLEIHNLKLRHSQLASEMERREYKHNSPLPNYLRVYSGQINKTKNLKELIKRCKKCRNRIKQYEMQKL